MGSLPVLAVDPDKARVFEAVVDVWSIDARSIRDRKDQQEGFFALDS